MHFCWLAADPRRSAGADIDVLSARIAELTAPWQGQLMILDSIIGVGPRAAEIKIWPRSART
jgi:hypothetical protein